MQKSATGKVHSGLSLCRPQERRADYPIFRGQSRHQPAIAMGKSLFAASKEAACTDGARAPDLAQRPVETGLLLVVERIVDLCRPYQYAVEF
jgi:hypothetical protein